MRHVINFEQNVPHDPSYAGQAVNSDPTYTVVVDGSHNKVEVGALAWLDVDDVRLLSTRSPLACGDGVATRWHHHVHVLGRADLETATEVSFLDSDISIVLTDR